MTDFCSALCSPNKSLNPRALSYDSTKRIAEHSAIEERGPSPVEFSSNFSRQSELWPEQLYRKSSTCTSHTLSP